MKKIDTIFDEIDQKVDKKMRPFWRHFKYIFPVFSAAFLGFLFIFFIFKILHDRPNFVANLIETDLKNIVECLAKIDKDCNILNIESEKLSINFLTVEKFVGSEVGGLNLVYPQNWTGPYLKDNPTYHGRHYYLLKAKEGLFVVPADGVKLPNGLKVGKDFVINYDSSVNKMLADGGELNYKGHLLGCKLDFQIGDWDVKKITPQEVEKINSALEEFNAAMPFTQNHTSQYKC